MVLPMLGRDNLLLLEDLDSSPLPSDIDIPTERIGEPHRVRPKRDYKGFIRRQAV